MSEVVDLQRKYIATLESELENANQTIAKLAKRVQELHIEMEQLRQTYGVAAHTVGNPDRARISG